MCLDTAGFRSFPVEGGSAVQSAGNASMSLRPFVPMPTMDADELFKLLTAAFAAAGGGTTGGGVGGPVGLGGIGTGRIDPNRLDIIEILRGGDADIPLFY